MPAPAVAKGIIISISIIAALGLAVIENPQIQAWLEEQRQKIAELLRSIGEELDPESRRRAEAFAYEGRTPANDAGLQREASASQEAEAVATGRTLSSASTIRRIPVRGPGDPNEAEERRRKGREYLAQRNQQMYELQQRKKAKASGSATPPTPTSFDAMVDAEGKLKLSDDAMPSVPSDYPVAENVREEMREVERSLSQPLLIGEESSSQAAWRMGTHAANPFDDENAMDVERADTPKPPVPPKVRFAEGQIRSDTPVVPGSFSSPIPSPRIELSETSHQDLSFEEQLALALSLSEADRHAKEMRVRRKSEAALEEAELRAAVEASLNEHMARQVSLEEPAPAPWPLQEISRPLIDVTPPQPVLPMRQPVPRAPSQSFFELAQAPADERRSVAPLLSQEQETEDELYRVTPELTRARLTSMETAEAEAAAARSIYAISCSLPSSSSVAQPPTSASQGPLSSPVIESPPTPPLIDISSETTLATAAPLRVASAQSSRSNDSHTDAETFASFPSSPLASSRSPSQVRNEWADVEVVDVTEDDSDVDMLSEIEPDGIATPDSWTEVGSHDGDSEGELRGGTS